MRRICAKQDRECCIDCPGSGYAFYHRPDGPCSTGCSDEDAAYALKKIFQRGGHEGKYAGQMIGVSSRTLATFAAIYRSQAPSGSAIYLMRLSKLRQIAPRKTYDIKFKAFSVADAIKQIAIATDDPGELTRQPVLSSA